MKSFFNTSTMWNYINCRCYQYVSGIFVFFILFLCVFASKSAKLVNEEVLEESHTTPDLFDDITVEDDVSFNNKEVTEDYVWPSIESKIEKLPACDDKQNFQQSSEQSGLLLVSTLDGKVSSFDLRTGKITWSHNIGLEPLLSSSTPHLLMKADGSRVKLAPTLDGYLYQVMENNNMDPLPLEVDTLLTSSVNIANDMSFTGKKTSEIYGISLKSGTILYHCGSDGCRRGEDGSSTSESLAPYTSDGNSDDVLVLRRVSYDVRGFDLLEGMERFNMSFGQHEVELVRAAGCKATVDEDSGIRLDSLSSLPSPRFVIPTGTVCGENMDGTVAWTEQLSSPITGAWHVIGGQVTRVDLLQATNIPALTPISSNVMTNPDLYVGVHDGQVYIQHSERQRNKIKALIAHASLFKNNPNIFLDGKTHRPSILWKPYKARGTQMMLAADNHDLLGIEYKPDGDKETSEQDAPTAQDGNNSQASSRTDTGFFLFLNDFTSTTPAPSQSPLTITEGVRPTPAPVRPPLIVPHISEQHTYSFDFSWSMGKPTSILAFCATVFAIVAGVTLLVQRVKAWVLIVPKRMLLYLLRYDTEVQQTVGNIASNNNNTNGNMLENRPASIAIEATASNDDSAEQTLAVDTIGSSLAILPISGVNSSVRISNAENLARYLSYDSEDDTMKGTIPVTMNLTGKNCLNININNTPPSSPPPTQPSPPATTDEAGSPQVTAVSGDTSSTPLVYHMTDEQFVPEPNFLIDPTNYSEINTIHIIDVIGCGGFGVVFEAYSKMLQRSYAMKRIYVPGGVQNKTVSKFFREVVQHTKIVHPNVISFNTCFVKSHSHDEAAKIDEWWKKKVKENKDKLFATYESPDDGTLSRSILTGMPYTQPSEYSTREHPVQDFQTDFQRQMQELQHDDSDDSEDEPGGDTLDDHTEDSSVSEPQQRSWNPSGDSTDDSIIFDNADGNARLSDSSYEDYDSNEDSVQFQQDGEDSVQFGTDDQHTKEEEFKRKKDRDSLSLDLVSKSRPENEENKMYLYIQLELCSKKSLRHWLLETTERPRPLIHKYFLQIVKAIEVIHDRCLIHRDLKPSNILFSLEDPDVLKVGDFGLCIDFEDHVEGNRGDNAIESVNNQRTRNAGTRAYMSPETASGRSKSTCKVDIYSLGLILLEMLVVMRTDTEKYIIFQDVRNNIFPQGVAESFPEEYELLQIMLHSDPTKRPSTRGIRARDPFRRLQSKDELDEIQESDHFALPTQSRHRRNTSTGSTGIQLASVP